MRRRGQYRQQYQWHEVHRPLLERLPGLRRLVLNDVLPGADVPNFIDLSRFQILTVAEHEVMLPAVSMA